MDAVIRTQNLSKKYGSSFALKNVSITVRPGDIYGLVGRNAAGKTTLFKVISGLTLPSSGELELFSQTSEEGLNTARKRTGCLIDRPAFYPYLSAEKNLEYYRRQRGIPGKKCIHEVLDLVDLADTGSKKYKDFSLGMKQRLGIALAILGNPDLLILDEPINGLDPVGIVKYRGLMHRLNTEKNITMIISSHILGELSRIATRYGFIDQGTLLQEISTAEIAEKCSQHLAVTVDDTSRAAVVLESIMECNEYTVLDNNIIKVYQFLDRSDQLTQTLVGNGVGVFSITREGMGMEDYFLNLVGGSRSD